MGAWVDRLATLAADAGPSALALVALAALAQVATRQPARRLRLTRAAVLGLLLLVPLELLVPWPKFDLLAAARAAGVLHGPRPLWWSAETGRPGPALRLLAAAYAVGVGLALARLLLGYAGLAWVARRSSAPSPDTLALYQSLPYGGARRPALRVSRRVRHPVVVGFPKVTILVPPGLDPPDPPPALRERLRLSLLHELAHAEGHDPWAVFAGQLALAVWFVLPPLWWLVGRMRLDQEFLADRRAALGFGPAGDYAASLLDLAADPTGSAVNSAVPREAPGPGPHDPGLGGSPLFQRVLMLLRCPFPVEPWAPSWWAWGLPCLAVAITLGLSRVTVRPAPAAPPPSAAGKFLMPRLDMPQTPAGPHGRAAPVELPIRLPEHFRLWVEVYGDLQTLAQMRVAGVRIETPATSSDATAAPETWHRVRLDRDGQGVRLWVDGQPATPHPVPTPLTSWLTLEPPPDRPCRFRALDLRW